MHRSQDPPRTGGSMKHVIGLLALAFAITLGVVVGTRMSSDALAVLVGVVAGVAASIPTALLLMAVSSRREAEIHAERDDAPGRGSPPVIVVTPGNASPGQLPYDTSYGYPTSLSRPQRQFRVMGYDDEDEPATEDGAKVVGWHQ